MSFLHGDAESANWAQLRAVLHSCGYFPALVEDTVALAVGDEELLAYVVHHEPTFNRDEIRRHLTVLALTPTRLVVGHTDEQPAEEFGDGATQAASSSESIPLSAINTIALTRVVDRPAEYRAGDPVAEAWLSVSWGAMRRLDIEPATCGDPQCDADHGFSGSLVPDDLTVRMSAAADGHDAVGQLIRFTLAIQRRVGPAASRSTMGGRR